TRFSRDWSSDVCSSDLGNSMGWYTTLFLGSCLTISNSFELINTMGSMMKNEIIGGQVIYPIIDENWKIDQEKKELIEKIVKEIRSEERRVGKEYKTRNG